MTEIIFLAVLRDNPWQNTPLLGAFNIAYRGYVPPHPFPPPPRGEDIRYEIRTTRYESMADTVGFLLPRRSRFSAEAGHPHWRSLSSLFFHWKHLGWLRIPRSFLFVSFLTIYDSWRTQLQPIRTIGEISAYIKILPARQPYLYERFSKKATQLRLLGMTYGEIARSLNINRKTATEACKYRGR